MSITPWLPAVRKIKDGEAVDQATVNVPIEQLTQREQHLFEKFEEISGKSALISFGQPLHPSYSKKFSVGEMSIVFFNSDDAGTGLAKGTAGFSSNKSSSMFSPNKSNYVFGLLKAVYPKTQTADVYTEGLCELTADIDDPVYGLLQKTNNVVEPFNVGPYFLSLKQEGKLTSDPSGVPVYVGYALSKRKFLLHTSVDEFSQFFINYRYHLLDRVAGVPSLANDTWSIATSNYTDSNVTYVGAPLGDNGVTVADASTNYVGYTSPEILSDTYLVTVTTAGNIQTVRFSISSSSSAFATKTSQSITQGNLLNVDTNGLNLVKLNFTGSTYFSLGAVWAVSVVSKNTSRLGWIPANEAGVPAPDGAAFYYNIPNTADLNADLGLDTYLDSDENIIHFERDEAAELKKYLPPIPANFVQLYINGVLGRYKDTYDTAGLFSINDYGLWWHSTQDGEQPWSSNYPTGDAGKPVNWKFSIKEGLSGNRKNLFMSFSRFNPALRTQLVSSLRPFDRVDTLGNKVSTPSNFLKFLNESNPAEASSTGGLLYEIDAKFEYTGSTDNSDAEYPASLSSSYTANRAIAALKYSIEKGLFQAVTTPVVAKIKGYGGISVSEDADSPGTYNLTYLSQGYIGQIDSIEPINSRLEFLGLSSYIKLPPPTTTPYGLIGKIVYPKGFISNKPLNIVMQLFGDVSSETKNTVALQFEYSVVTSSNGAVTTSHSTLTSLSNRNSLTGIVEFSIAPSGNYAANTALKISEGFTIPAEFIAEDSVINYKLVRVATSDPTANSYVGNIGLLSTYWEISS
jgi:hypothetical protein